MTVETQGRCADLVNCWEASENPREVCKHSPRESPLSIFSLTNGDSIDREVLHGGTTPVLGSSNKRLIYQCG